MPQYLPVYPRLPVGGAERIRIVQRNDAVILTEGTLQPQTIVKW